MIPFLDVGATYAELREELDAAYARVMTRGWYVMGQELEAFEDEFARYCGCEAAVGVASGLDALVLPLRAWGIGPGDEVLVPDFTFVATWLAVSQVGATPVGVPCDVAYGMDPDAARRAITPRTRAMIPVHLYGQTAQMDALCALGREHDVRVLEDAAQAHGARFLDARAGSLGDAAAFSFYPGKNLGAFGDGGGVTTRDAELARAVARLRNYGSEVKYHHTEQGTNSRLDELQAALLRVKLRHLDAWNARRQQLAARYHEGLASTPLALPIEREGARSVWHLYVVQTEEREALMAHLSARGVQAAIHYPIPPAAQPCYADAPAPAAEAITCGERVLSLPIGPHLSDEDCAHVIGAIRDYYDR